MYLLTFSVYAQLGDSGLGGRIYISSYNIRQLGGWKIDKNEQTHAYDLPVRSLTRTPSNLL